jgi:hypothetical protein
MTLLGVRLPNEVSPGRAIGIFEKDQRLLSATG